MNKGLAPAPNVFADVFVIVFPPLLRTESIRFASETYVKDGAACPGQSAGKIERNR